eukprot:jgi/Botrbrau1/12118/Bobra.0186s0036.1
MSRYRCRWVRVLHVCREVRPPPGPGSRFCPVVMSPASLSRCSAPQIAPDCITMTALNVVVKYPKSQLHEFYQRHAGTPTFDTDPIPGGTEPRFRCVVTCPAITVNNNVVSEERTFVGEARAKKQAEHAASESALAYLRGLGLVPAEQPPPVHPAVLVPNNGPMTVGELAHIRSRIMTLAVQLNSLAVPAGVPAGEIDAGELSVEEVDGMSEGEVRRRLKEAISEIARLKLALERERNLRRMAADVLAGNVSAQENA